MGNWGEQGWQAMLFRMSIVQSFIFAWTACRIVGLPHVIFCYFDMVYTLHWATYLDLGSSGRKIQQGRH